MAIEVQQVGDEVEVVQRACEMRHMWGSINHWRGDAGPAESRKVGKLGNTRTIGLGPTRPVTSG
ncbi:hypothetical protein X768_14275 [Mesorhizobium sp. LSJC265A00]|nr:hypothetical protein X768_14275 [Mesorhizobium sp. LSJC265A00]ESX20955.1 hypothetical protein X766_04465 [Mesorhizobium sp. LSJC255A00]